MEELFRDFGRCLGRLFVRWVEEGWCLVIPGVGLGLFLGWKLGKKAGLWYVTKYLERGEP